MKPQKVSVVCPRCGQSQQEPTAAYSTRCRKCGEHFRLEDVLRPQARPDGYGPAARRPEAPRDLRRVACFQCGTALDVPTSAQSTMCKRCSAHVDLRDYDFTATVSKNFKTRGNCVLHEGACLLNTDSTFGHAVIKGKIIGRITADELELHKTAEIKGGFKAGNLVLPAGTVLRWPETVVVNSADIAGEFIGSFRSTGTITVRSTGRLFGDVEGGGLATESGAIVVGTMKLGVKPPEPTVVAKPGASIVPLPAGQLAFALPAH